MKMCTSSWVPHTRSLLVYTDIVDFVSRESLGFRHCLLHFLPKPNWAISSAVLKWVFSCAYSRTINCSGKFNRVDLNTVKVNRHSLFISSSSHRWNLSVHPSPRSDTFILSTSQTRRPRLVRTPSGDFPVIFHNIDFPIGRPVTQQSKRPNCRPGSFQIRYFRANDHSSMLRKFPLGIQTWWGIFDLLSTLSPITGWRVMMGFETALLAFDDKMTVLLKRIFLLIPLHLLVPNKAFFKGPFVWINRSIRGKFISPNQRQWPASTSVNLRLSA